MTSKNSEVVAGALFPQRVDLIAAFVQGEYERLFDRSLIAPDLEVVFAQPSGPPLTYQGFEGLVEGWRDWLTPWASYEVEVEDRITAGDCVVALAVLRGETERDHVRLEQPAAAVATLRDGKVARLEFHLDREAALESAGLK